MPPKTPTCPGRWREKATWRCSFIPAIDTRKATPELVIPLLALFGATLKALGVSVEVDQKLPRLIVPFNDAARANLSHPAIFRASRDDEDGYTETHRVLGPLDFSLVVAGPIGIRVVVDEPIGSIRRNDCLQKRRPR